MDYLLPLRLAPRSPHRPSQTQQSHSVGVTSQIQSCLQCRISIRSRPRRRRLARSWRPTAFYRMGAWCVQNLSGISGASRRNFNDPHPRSLRHLRRRPGAVDGVLHGQQTGWLWVYGDQFDDWASIAGGLWLTQVALIHLVKGALS